jgi:solute carrier family 13 (sodium-dependent dicarboxylate transporter), member 2/3/5
MTPPPPDPDLAEASPLAQKLGLILGPLLAGLLLLLPPPDGISRDAWIVVALAAVMALWWMTEAVPMAMTAMLPIIVLPLTGVSTVKEATTPFAEPIIFLLLGGFIIALSIERWGLHKRIALAVLARVGTSPSRLVLGFILATGFLSMWISNSATTMMMLPIALSVAAVMADKQLGRALLLGVAYAASIGGMATLIGTPPNIMAAGYIQQSFGREISFLDWMQVGVPVMLVMLPAIWLVITRVTHRVEDSASSLGAQVIADARSALGAMTSAERRTALICVAVALCWMFRAVLQDLPGLGRLSDDIIAVGFALLLFLVPAGGDTAPGTKLLAWSDTVKINWGVILLFGGGLSLAAAIDKTGLAAWLGSQLAGVTDWHPLLLALLLAAAVCFLSEIASNTALVAALLPVLGATAKATGMDPMLLILPATLAASCGFMLPAATGPNAIAFGTGRLRAGDMLRAGILLDLLGIISIAVLTTLLLG